MICEFCGFDNGDFDEVDRDYVNNGYWCYGCDCYNFFNKSDDSRKLNIILETKSNIEDIKISKPPIKFNKRISPLRYPGGKSKMVEYVYSKIEGENIDVFVEPFAGGASVGLSLLEAGVINKLVISDKDYGIYSLFKTILDEPMFLIEKIKTSELTHIDYFEAQNCIKNNYKGLSIYDAAWSCLVVNRLSYSGICKANPLGGKCGTKEQLLSRWSAKGLIDRIEKINNLKDKIEVLNEDGHDLIGDWYWMDNTFIFIDPPYYKKGKDLYNMYFTSDDHIRLSILITGLYREFPGAKMLVTYDDDNYIEDLYSGFDIEKMNRKYCI